MTVGELITILNEVSVRDRGPGDRGAASAEVITPQIEAVMQRAKDLALLQRILWSELDPAFVGKIAQLVRDRP